MNEKQRVFKLEKMYRRGFLFGALTTLFVFLFAVLVWIKDPLESRAGIYAFYALEVLLFVVIIHFARVYFGYESYTVNVEPDGLRFGAKETAPVVPWSDIGKLKMGGTGNRINVLGRDNKILGTIKLQLDGIDRLVHTILNAMPQTDTLPASTAGTRRFKGPLTSFVVWGLLPVGFGVLTVFQWSTPGSTKYLGLLLTLVFLFLIPLFVKTEIRWIEFTDTHLVIKTLASQKSYTRKRIRAVELFVPTPKNQGKSMNVLIYTGKKKTVEICPSNQDPFEIFWTCRRFLDRSDEIRVFNPQEEE